MTNTQENAIANAKKNGWSVTMNPQGRFPLADYGWTLRKDGNGTTEMHNCSSESEAWLAILHTLPIYTEGTTSV